MPRSRFAVIESRWWDDGNHSVRALFEAVCAIHHDNPSAFYYDMFADRSSLRRVLGTRGGDDITEVLYVATHGNETEIGPGNGVTISRTEFRNALEEGNANAQVKGLYLGTCLTGNMNTARFLLDQRTRLEWLAGYRETVDWIDGSAIDMVFFHKLAAEYRRNKSRRRGKLTAREMAHEAASQLLRLVPGAHATYGFNIYFRERDGAAGMFA
ncbi:hypothetical protein RAMLITH_13640 [Ramlibacter sp. RBP-2]|uniref:CHAT domain-containing protein n=1 Tax=Ramlibacter lithotrophicus TaxID=2606681 RepID=A0A7X6DGR3_9BURK|nr:hypothetical protein [Ramlibacter lithotrophicus]NKE66867.1 hypothetical protein [Ramlibacter lithotrophicus]